MFTVISCPLPFQLPGVKESLLAGGSLGREGKRGETEGTGRAETKEETGRAEKGRKRERRTARPPGGPPPASPTAGSHAFSGEGARGPVVE